METGLRAGEALALEWGDIDVEKQTLKVCKNVIWVDGKHLVQNTTKTEAGKRTDPLNNRAMEAVQHMKAQAVPGFSFVFATQTRGHVSYRHLLKTMVLASKVAGAEKRGIHALRHSYASNLYARDVEGDVDDTFRQAVGT